MHHRKTETILSEWRILERALASSSDPEERIDLERAVATLADEYHETVDALASRGHLDELSGLDLDPAPPDSAPAA